MEPLKSEGVLDSPFFGLVSNPAIFLYYYFSFARLLSLCLPLLALKDPNKRKNKIEYCQYSECCNVVADGVCASHAFTDNDILFYDAVVEQVCCPYTSSLSLSLSIVLYFHILLGELKPSIYINIFTR